MITILNHVDHSKMFLGKAAPVHIEGLPAISNYTPGLPSSPSLINWSTKLTNLGMMLNDTLENCTCAAAGHSIQTWTSLTGTEFIPPDSAILQMYEEACGYIPGKPKTDQGGVESKVLQWWTKNAVAGHEIVAFASVNPKNLTDVKDTVWLLGSSYIGLALPLTAQTQTVWHTPAGGPVGRAAPGSWGGHAVPVVAYNERGLVVITWGQLKLMTWGFWHDYVDEAYAIISKDWINTQSGNAPSGFNWNQLVADFQLL